MRTANSRFRLNIFEAISPDDDLHFIVHQGKGTADRFLTSLDQLIVDNDGKICLNIDILSIDSAALIQRLITDKTDLMKILCQPKYAPTVNSIELE